jgi:hypothetical protein
LIIVARAGRVETHSSCGELPVSREYKEARMFETISGVKIFAVSNLKSTGLELAICNSHHTTSMKYNKIGHQI